MANAKNQVKTASEDAATKAQTIAQDAATKAKAFGAEAAETAKAQVEARADAAKEAAADEVTNVASALRKAAAESRTGSAQERTFGQIANSLADASEAISNKDLGTVVEDVSTFARKNPLTFLAGAAFAGVAVSRFLKASERHDVAINADAPHDQGGA